MARLEDGGASAFGLGLPGAEMTESAHQERSTARVLLDVTRERQRQLDRWGTQRHRDGTSVKTFAVLAKWARRFTERHARENRVTWTDILREEFYEALAEEDPVKLRAELVQTAAVCVAWVEDLDTRDGEPDAE